MAMPAWPVNDVRDILLTDIAIRVQLSPTNYRLAVDRVHTLAEWLDRDDSELRGRVTLIYPQGSMAINATIASRLRHDEFDVDVIAQIDVPQGWTAQQVLDALYRAIRGDRGSRYYAMTTRNTRCVTVHYAEMHVDLTPAELIRDRKPRVSHIFHHRAEENGPGVRIVANPYGFAEWFNVTTPRDIDYGRFFAQRSRELDVRINAKADTEDVPEQTAPFEKPIGVVALQLIKRFRNVQYDARAGRRPPSVVLAKYLAESGSGSGRPFAELLYQARRLLAIFAEHDKRSAKVHVVNPSCPEDIFTDRWPNDLAEQFLFTSDLRTLVAELEVLEKDPDLKAISDVYSRLFGEDVTESVIRTFADRTGASTASGRLRSDQTGRVDLRGSGIISVAATAPVSASRSSPRHTFYGRIR